MINEGGNEGWERFRKRQGKTLKKILNKMRKQEKNKALQFKQFGNKKVAKDAVRARESFGEGIGAAYMPKAGKAGVPEREITSKAVRKQLNRNRNRAVMKGDLETPHVRYVHSRDKSTDYIRPERKKRRFKKKMKEAYPAGYESDMNKMADKEKNTWWKSQDKAKVAADKKKAVKYNPKRSRSIDHSLKRAAKYAELSYELRNESKPGFYDKDGKKVNNVDAYLKKQDAMRDARRKKVAAFAKDKGLSYQDRIKHVLQKEGIGAAYMPQAGKGKTAERELTSKAILKQLNRNRNKSTMKGKTEVPHIRYVNARDKSTDLIRPEKRKKRGGKKKVRKEGYNLVEKASPKMTQLLRMGLAKKGELHTMLRAIKRGPDAMKDPKLRSKMFELLNKLVDIIEKDGQIFVKVRQNVQKNRADLQAVEEMLALEGVILGVNKSFEQLNITEDMSGMSVSSGHKRSVAQGAGMTKKGVAAYRRRNPGSKLKTAVTTPPSKLKPGSKAAKRRKAFCSRSRSWSSERGKAARRRWNC